MTKEFLALKALMSHSWDFLVITWRLCLRLCDQVRGMEEPFRYQFGGGSQHQASLGLRSLLDLAVSESVKWSFSPYSFWSVSPYASVSQKFQTCILICPAYFSLPALAFSGLEACLVITRICRNLTLLPVKLKAVLAHLELKSLGNLHEPITSTKFCNLQAHHTPSDQTWYETAFWLWKRGVVDKFIHAQPFRSAHITKLWKLLSSRTSRSLKDITECEKTKWKLLLLN